MKEVTAHWLGRIGYQECWDLQRELHATIAAGQRPPTLLLLEHEPVITLGRHGLLSNIRLSSDELSKRGIELHRCERGGDVTFHGPGQLVGYPLLNIKELHLTVAGYLRRLEESLILLLSGLAVTVRREPGLTGVWHETGKIAAIGIAVKRWVTFHGFALNVTTDLDYFSLLNPCGLSRPVTSLKALTGSEPACREVAERYLPVFSQTFGVRVSDLREGVPWPLHSPESAA